jgi:excisionase family DNA binding protein
VNTGGPKLISPQELQEILGCGRTFCYELLARGEIPSHKLGRLRRIRLSDLERWLEDNKFPPGA